jgi:hypothetical protein
MQNETITISFEQIKKLPNDANLGEFIRKMYTEKLNQTNESTSQSEE